MTVRYQDGSVGFFVAQTCTTESSTDPLMALMECSVARSFWGPWGDEPNLSRALQATEQLRDVSRDSQGQASPSIGQGF